MKNYRNYIETALNSLEDLFTEIDKLFLELRTHTMHMRFDGEIDNEEYYTHVKETFDKLSDRICKMCHTIGPAASITQEMVEKNEMSEESSDEENCILDIVVLNMNVYMKKHKMYTEMYEEFKFFAEEADEFFAKKQ